MTKRIIPVTIPFTGSKASFLKLAEQIWENAWFTNNGPLVKKLEQQLAPLMHAGGNTILVNNATTGLQLAIKALKLKGEIITTPFSYVATTSVIAWENCEPVFADIEPDYFNIDPDKIEALITPQTTGILATHIFGNPCNMQAIDSIAKKHGLKVIYDAAHAFGVSWKNQQIFEFGDISIASFHATKMFHTAEGGAVCTSNSELAEALRKMRNFGFIDDGNISVAGINAKMSELHAALGLANLEFLDEVRAGYRRCWMNYYEFLKESGLRLPVIVPETDYNYSYFPLLFPDEHSVLRFLSLCADGNVYPKRYFYPSLNLLPYVLKTHCPVSEDISSRIVCLPLFAGMDIELQQRIAECAKQSIVAEHAVANS